MVVGFGIYLFIIYTEPGFCSSKSPQITKERLYLEITVVASSVLGEAITGRKQKIDLSLYIKANASEDVLRTLAGKLRIQPNVTEVDISTSENEYKKASKDNVEGWSLVVDEGIKPAIPAVIHVKLADMSKRKAIEKFISGDPQFKQWVDSSVANSQDVEARQQTIKAKCYAASCASLRKRAND